MPTLYVNMFGEFSIRTETANIGEMDNRSRKVWMLLAYLLYHRDRVVKSTELCDLLWSESEQEKNTASAMKTLLYRLRIELDKLWDGAGKELIQYRGNGYSWNNDVPLEMDCDRFDKLLETIEQSPEVVMSDVIALLKLYKGEFLERYSMEFWVTPNTAYYHNAYIACLLHILPTLMEENKYEEAAAFCRIAAAVEPFHEGIHCYWMKACVGLKNYKKAGEIYHDLRERLLNELGILPSEEIREIYAEVTKFSNDSTLSVEYLKLFLKEEESQPGAMICEFDFFRLLYRSLARSIARNGYAVHLALVTMQGRNVTEQNERRWKKLCSNVEESIRTSTRRGDSATQCSTSQFLVMLPRANYENSCMVCERIERAYYRKNSRLDIELSFEVFPLEPDDKENLQWIR